MSENKINFMKKLSVVVFLLCNVTINLTAVPVHDKNSVYFSRSEFTELLQEYGYTQNVAKQFEEYIYRNGLREYLVEDESVINKSINLMKPYISTTNSTDIETYNILYICKKGKLYAFPSVIFFETIKIDDNTRLQYNFYKRYELVSYFVSMGLNPKNAVTFENKIYNSIYEVNYLLLPTIRETMQRYEVEYSVPVFEISHIPIGIINIKHDDLFYTVNLQYIFDSCFPNESKSFYDEQLGWYTLLTLEGLSFKLTLNGINQKELILDMQYMNNKLNSEHIATNILINNQLLSSNYTFALLDEPDNSGWMIYYKVSDKVYLFSSKEFLSK